MRLISNSRLDPPMRASLQAARTTLVIILMRCAGRKPSSRYGLQRCVLHSFGVGAPALPFKAPAGRLSMRLLGAAQNPPRFHIPRRAGSRPSTDTLQRVLAFDRRPARRVLRGLSGALQDEGLMDVGTVSSMR